MYFETATATSSSLQLPFNSFDTTKKKYFGQIRSSNNNGNLNSALLLLMAIVAIILTSTTGLSFGVADSPAAFVVRPVPTNNDISSGIILRASPPEVEIAPLTFALDQPTDEDQQRYINVFEEWNLPQDQYENKVCDERMQRELCPREASVSCGSIDKVEQFCKALLGSSNTRSSTANRDAVEGCKIYVSWNHGSCCHATFCETEYGDDESGDDDMEPEF